MNISSLDWAWITKFMKREQLPGIEFMRDINFWCEAFIKVQLILCTSTSTSTHRIIHRVMFGPEMLIINAKLSYTHIY